MSTDVRLSASQLKTITCEREKCGNATFVQTFLIKHVPALLSPTGNEGLMPIPVYACNACGGINKGFLNSITEAVKSLADEDSSQPAPSRIIGG
jgi:hypothetical protein